MRARLDVLASGSSGNALLVLVGEVALLVDVGLPYAVLAPRLRRAGVAPEALAGVVLTHEHADHARGLAELAARHPGVPRLATAGTARALAREGGPPPSGLLRDGAPHEMRGLTLRPFAVPHDAAEPIGVRIECGALAMAVATDLGAVTDAVRRACAGCAALVVEANHDVDLLARGPYPAFLKRRVASRRGHLSNDDAAALLRAVAHPGLAHVTLAHGSAANNSPERALAAAERALERHGRVVVAVAARHGGGPPVEVAFDARAAAPGAPAARQLALFDPPNDHAPVAPPAPRGPRRAPGPT